MTDRSQERPETGPAHQLVEAAVALLALGFGVLVLVGSLKVGINWGAEGPRPGFFPFYISLFIIAGSAINLVHTWSGSNVRRGIFSSWAQLLRVLSVVVPTAIFVALVPVLGIYVASALLIVVFMMALGGYNAWTTLPIAIGIPVIAFTVFERYFQIALPKGPLEAWLGL
jgi:putative tricarboxylic transport membrane protein